MFFFIVLALGLALPTWKLAGHRQTGPYQIGCWTQHFATLCIPKSEVRLAPFLDIYLSIALVKSVH